MGEGFSRQVKKGAAACGGTRADVQCCGEAAVLEPYPIPRRHQLGMRPADAADARVSHQFLWRVLERLGFGPSFVRWVRSRVNVNRHWSDLFLQEAGVRQGCPMSPLLFVLYIEPFAVAVRREQAIRGLGLPGTGGREVKLAQYADDATLLLRDERSLDRALEIVKRFSRAAGAKLNMEKSVVKLVGEWKERREFMGGIRVSKRAIRILGVDFGGGNDGEVNWMKRIRKVRMKLGLWQKRKLSIAGKILVIKAEVLPALVFLARVFPLPPRLKRGVQSAVFRFLWGGYEYVAREVMVQPVEKGGRAVPDIGLKMDVLFFTCICVMLVRPEPHAAFSFVRLWMAGSLRYLGRWDNSVPNAEQLPPYYWRAVQWAGRVKESRSKEVCINHRALYAAVVERMGSMQVQRVPRDTWRAMQMKGLENRVKDLNWLVVHQRLPVREVQNRHRHISFARGTHAWRRRRLLMYFGSVPSPGWYGGRWGCFLCWWEGLDMMM